jgi:hypothetical protein
MTTLTVRRTRLRWPVLMRPRKPDSEENTTANPVVPAATLASRTVLK